MKFIEIYPNEEQFYNKVFTIINIYHPNFDLENSIQGGVRKLYDFLAIRYRDLYFYLTIAEEIHTNIALDLSNILISRWSEQKSIIINELNKQIENETVLDVLLGNFDKIYMTDKPNEDVKLKEHLEAGTNIQAMTLTKNLNIFSNLLQMKRTNITQILYKDAEKMMNKMGQGERFEELPPVEEYKLVSDDGSITISKLTSFILNIIVRQSIQDQVETNKDDITDNKTDIDDNKTAIENNTTEIAKKVDIANFDAIQGLKIVKNVGTKINTIDYGLNDTNYDWINEGKELITRDGDILKIHYTDANGNSLGTAISIENDRIRYFIRGQTNTMVEFNHINGLNNRNYKIYNLANGINPLDGVNLSQLTVSNARITALTPVIIHPSGSDIIPASGFLDITLLSGRDFNDYKQIIINLGYQTAYAGDFRFTLFINGTTNIKYGGILRTPDNNDNFNDSYNVMIEILNPTTIRFSLTDYAQGTNLTRVDQIEGQYLSPIGIKKLKNLKKVLPNEIYM